MIRAGYRERGEAWAGIWKCPSRWSKAALTSVGDRSTSTLTSLDKGKCGHLLCQFCLWLTKIRLAQYGSSKCHLIWPGVLDTSWWNWVQRLLLEGQQLAVWFLPKVLLGETKHCFQCYFSMALPANFTFTLNYTHFTPPFFLSVSETAQWGWHLPLSDSIWIGWPILQKYLLRALWFAQGFFSLPENL